MILTAEIPTPRIGALAELARQHSICEAGTRRFEAQIPPGIRAFLRESGIAQNLEPGADGPGVEAWLREMAWVGGVCSTTAHLMMTQSMPLYAIMLADERWAKAEDFDALLSFEKIGCFCLTEPGGGTDAGSLATLAVANDGGYRLSGKKCMIMNAAVSDLFLVAARLEGTSGYEGITLFLVHAGSPGLAVAAPEEMMGLDGVPLSDISLDGVWVPNASIVGPPGGGWPILMQVLDRTRPAVGAYCVGMGQTALRLAAAHAAQRTVFGKPLAKYQTTTNALADAALALESAWLLVREAGTRIVAGEPSSALSAAAKVAGSEAAQNAAEAALQLFGGYGYLRRTGIERIVRDLRVASIYDGANEILRGIMAGGAIKALAEKQE